MRRWNLALALLLLAFTAGCAPKAIRPDPIDTALPAATSIDISASRNGEFGVQLDKESPLMFDLVRHTTRFGVTHPPGIPDMVFTITYQAQVEGRTKERVHNYLYYTRQGILGEGPRTHWCEVPVPFRKWLAQRYKSEFEGPRGAQKRGGPRRKAVPVRDNFAER